MIRADLHLHTCFSHGVPTPFEMHAQAIKRKFRLIGFSEHSPRPLGYDYTNEYRAQLELHLNDYKSQVHKLKENAATNPESCQVLYGMEMDWLDNEDFVEKAVKSSDFDYLLGSVHFIGHWGFDDKKEDWENLSQEECDKIYERYFISWRKMIKSGFFDIAAHPDLIKIFSPERFCIWLDKRESKSQVYGALELLKKKGMALEVSTAGLRKPCREIYPCPQILHMAKELDIPVALASDSHRVADFGFAFDKLERMVKNYGWKEQAIFNKGIMTLMPF